MKRSAYIAIALAAAITIVAPASADRVIFAPTGMVLDAGEIRAEGAISPSNDDSQVYWLGLGLQRLEINAVRLQPGGAEAPAGSGSIRPKSRYIFSDVAASGDTTVLGAELGILPETTLTPGIGVGVWDVTNETPDDRGYYLAISKAVPLTSDIPSPIRDIRVHAGFGTQGIDGFFAGAEATIPLGLKLSAEYFRQDFNFSVGWGLLPGLQVKAYFLDGETFYGLQFSPPL